MRFRSTLSAVVLAGGLLVTPVTVHTADASTTAAAACIYKRDGNVWRCITPGAFCPAAAHNKYGYAKVTNRKYKCKSSSPRWRWLKP